jgi:predicted type IV restriction endonuclease
MSDVQTAKGDGATEAASKTGKAPARSLPKWESDARDRLRTSIRRFNKPLADMLQRDANEGDTRLLVTDFLCDALGFDKFEHLTTEYLVKGEFADYGIRLEKQLVAFLEVKRVATKLGVKHLRQVEMYAVNEGVEWIILTNGNEWQVYHLTGGLPVTMDLVMTVSLLDDSPLSEKVNQLIYLTRDSLKRRQIDELWLARRATSPKSLGTAILSEPALTAIRRELKRVTGHNIEISELARLLRDTVIRGESPS